MKKKLKIKDYLRDISNSNEEVASAIRENNRLLIEQTEIEQKKLKHEIETKDRVDISLKEYKEMKSKIELLEIKNKKYETIMEKIRLKEYEENIELETIKVHTTYDPAQMRNIVRIMFACDECPYRPYDIPHRPYDI